jgi:ABC-type transporter Mla subunit MlaD
VFDERTSRRVGGIMLVAVAIAMSAVLTVDCGRFRSSIEVTVYFAHPGALVEGADVQVAGRVIGQVRAVELIPVRAASAPDHPLYPTGGVAVHLAVRTRYAGWASPDGQFFVTAKGLLGESYLEIGPPVGDAAPSRGLRDGDRVRGIDPARLDLVLVRSFENTAAFRRLLDDLGPSAGELRTALDGLAATLDALEPSPGAYHDLAESVARATDQAHGLAERLRASGAAWGQRAAVAWPASSAASAPASTPSPPTSSASAASCPPTWLTASTSPSRGPAPPSPPSSAAGPAWPC